MTKPTKKRIDEIAAKLRRVFRSGCGLRCDSWKALDAYTKEAWRNLAKFVLTEPGLLPRKLLAEPKSCKLVHGKAVCK